MFYVELNVLCIIFLAEKVLLLSKHLLYMLRKKGPILNCQEFFTCSFLSSCVRKGSVLNSSRTFKTFNYPKNPRRTFEGLLLFFFLSVFNVQKWIRGTVKLIAKTHKQKQFAVGSSIFDQNLSERLRKNYLGLKDFRCEVVPAQWEYCCQATGK